MATIFVSKVATPIATTAIVVAFNRTLLASGTSSVGQQGITSRFDLVDRHRINRRLWDGDEEMPPSLQADGEHRWQRLNDSIPKSDLKLRTRFETSLMHDVRRHDNTPCLVH